MLFGQGGSFEHNFYVVRMNLGGPSETTYNKSRTAFITKSGVLKSVSLFQLKLLTKNNSNLSKAYYRTTFLLSFLVHTPMMAQL